MRGYVRTSRNTGVSFGFWIPLLLLVIFWPLLILVGIYQLLGNEKIDVGVRLIIGFGVLIFLLLSMNGVFNP
jgi:hypothetical protein